MWGHVENEQEMTAEILSSWVAVLNPAGIFVAFVPDNNVAGTCYALPADHAGPVDLVDTLGVSPPYRELKLQKPLLLTAMHWLRSQARKPAILQSFGDSEETVALYRESGFTLEHHYLSYQRQLA
jgi:GNAT superfamily N-acetyltransferase